MQLKHGLAREVESVCHDIQALAAATIVGASGIA
jgi:hypothetical protein